MLRERIKTSVVLILIVNLIFLTFHMWFFRQKNPMGDGIVRYMRNIPVVEKLFPQMPAYSIAKENLSKPRKFLINDGSLWMAYYNTDIGFSPIESRTRKIIKGFLSGDITDAKKTNYSTWEAGLESVSIYVEYPVAFSTDMFCRIMGVDNKNAPVEFESLRELIIIPSSDETNICILVRDASNNDSIYAYILNNNHSLPATDLSVYASNDGYYEPLFSTGLELNTENVAFSPLVLFSDSQPDTQVLRAENLLEKNKSGAILEAFGFNTVTVTPYEDSDGALNYIANYASAKVFPDSVFEYTAIEENKGILLDESGDAYSVLNASIDFAEKIWNSVSNEPLSILVTSDLADYDPAKPCTFMFDYYESGRPIEVELPAAYGHTQMKCAIEMTVSNGRLISYRQYMRSYDAVSSETLAYPFITALDGFIQQIESGEASATVEDIYIGYLDSGQSDSVHAGWLAKGADNRIFRYSPETEVSIP